MSEAYAEQYTLPDGSVLTVTPIPIVKPLDHPLRPGHVDGYEWTMSLSKDGFTVQSSDHVRPHHAHVLIHARMSKAEHHKAFRDTIGGAVNGFAFLQGELVKRLSRLTDGTFDTSAVKS